MIYTKTIRNIFFLIIVSLSSTSRAEIYSAKSIEEINNTIFRVTIKKKFQKNTFINVFGKVFNKTG